jgi:ribosomal protein S18 acetylase RimI-like enzyme
MHMSVATMHVVTDDLREQAWKLYREAFDPLRHTAVQRHVMYDDEFDAVMADPRVDKYLIYDADGTLQGLGTITNIIESMPLVSPEYFATRWPERSAEGRVFYIGFVGVHPSAHGSGIFAELVHAMTSVVAACDGIAILDVCRHNLQKLHLPRMISILASSWAPQVEMVDLDAQTYIGYDFMRAG